MSQIANNIIYNLYQNCYKTGDDSSIPGNAVSEPPLENDKLVIPPEIQGKPVIRIGSFSFRKIKIKSLTLPDSIQEIGNCALDECDLSLEELTLPKALTKIGFNAFSSNSIKSFVLDENVNSIEYGAFSHSTHLESIKVSANNKHFVSVNGVLYSKNKTVLYCSPYHARGFKIPFSVTTLMQRSVNTEYSKTIWVPQSITTFDYEAFFLIFNTQTIHFLGNVENITKDAVLSWSSSLKTIFYHGTTIYNENGVFSSFPNLKVYVCNEYESDYFAGIRVSRFGSCYSRCNTCRRPIKAFTPTVTIVIFLIST